MTYDRDPFRWMTPFEALEEAEFYRRRDYDYHAEVDEMRQRMRESYQYENACLRAQVEGLTQQIMKLSLTFPMTPPLILSPSDGSVQPQPPPAAKPKRS